MKSKILLIIAIVIIIILSCCLCLSNLMISHDQKFNVDYYPIRYFQFDAQALYSSRQSGEIPELKEISEQQYYKLEQVNLPNIVWTDDQMILIKRSLLKKLPIEGDMKLVGFVHDIPCGDIEGGSDEAIYFLSNYWIKKDGLHRLELELSISHLEQSIRVKLDEYFPSAVYWTNPIDVEKLHLTYQQVASIAEKSGKQICGEGNILVRYGMSYGKPYWDVPYYHPAYEIKIDDNTGKFLRPNTIESFIKSLIK